MTTLVKLSKSEGFEKKGLSEFIVNAGVGCSHGCTYCYTKAYQDVKKHYQVEGKLDFVFAKIPDEYKALFKQKHSVMLGSMSDLWDPLCLKSQVGLKTLGYFISQTDWNIRVLTKNCGVEDSFRMMSENVRYCTFSLSTGLLHKHDNIARVIEPYASPPSQRFQTLRRAYNLGIPIYGMACPILPGIYNTQEDIDNLITNLTQFDPLEIFTENLNIRGDSNDDTANALIRNGFAGLGAAVNNLKDRNYRSRFIVELYKRLADAVDRKYSLKKFRFFQYRSNLTPEHYAELKDQPGIIWL
jgi:DNA repair photolyase